MDDDADVWTYGTVLKNPGCDFTVMYLGNDRAYPYNDFKALVLHDVIDGAPEQVVLCGGRPDDPRDIRWVVLS
jgi:hypothetical protein